MNAAGLVGTSLPRSDGAAKVRGLAQFPHDLDQADCLHAATVRATLPHAIVRGIDTSRALALPGVKAVLTHRDVRGSNRFGLIEADQPVLAENRVRTAADVIAVVVATTAAIAREGARRVVCDLKPLPVLSDPARALDVDAPIVDPERADASSHPNLLAERTVAIGDAVRTLATAPVVVEARYRTGWVEHAFLGTEAGIAGRDGEGRLAIWTATQWPDEDLRQAAAALGEPVERLRLVQQAIGGAFGGREDISLQILLLLAARETGARVRMVWDREESIRGHGKRHPFDMRFRLGADHDGRLVALEAELLTDAGGYASTTAVVLSNAVEQAGGPYAIEHLLIRGRAVYTNNPVTCAFRGFGVNQVNYAMEQTVNRLAERLSMDPAALRLRNLVRPGGRLWGGYSFGAAHGLTECIERSVWQAEAQSLPAARGPWRHGRGLACAVKNTGYTLGFDDHATARVTVTRTGATVSVGAAEVGQGVETVLAQIAGDALGMPFDAIGIRWQDSADAPGGASSSASHQTFVSGNAVRLACERARLAVEDVGGSERLPDAGITISETYHAPRTHPSLEQGDGAYAYSWCACVADVAVDMETGRVRVLRVVQAVDAGRVLNPQLFTAQVEGGVVMGQGYALQERFEVEGSLPLTRTLGECMLPTAVDAAPEIEVIAVEAPDPNGPYGARGIGEVTMLPVVPALTAAIHAATGAWVDHLPAIPERVLEAIDNAPAQDDSAPEMSR